MQNTCEEVRGRGRKAFVYNTETKQSSRENALANNNKFMRLKDTFIMYDLIFRCGTIFIRHSLPTFVFVPTHLQHSSASLGLLALLFYRGGEVICK